MSGEARRNMLAKIDVLGEQQTHLLMNSCEHRPGNPEDGIDNRRVKIDGEMMSGTSIPDDHLIGT